MIFFSASPAAAATPSKKKVHPGFPVAVGTNGRQAAVILCLVLFQISADIPQGLRQHPSTFEQGRDEQASDAPVAVKKGVDGFKLSVDECHLHHGG